MSLLHQRDLYSLYFRPKDRRVMRSVSWCVYLSPLFTLPPYTGRLSVFQGSLTIHRRSVYSLGCPLRSTVLLFLIHVQSSGSKRDTPGTPRKKTTLVTYMTVENNYHPSRVGKEFHTLRSIESVGETFISFLPSIKKNFLEP